MELSPQILWGIVGGFIGASLVSIVFLILLLPRKEKKSSQPKKAPLPVEVIEVEKIVKEASPASFQISDLSITPSQAQEGEPVIVSAQVTNVGGTRGSYSATLMLNGRIVATKGVILEPASSMPVTFVIKERTSGKYIVEVDGLKGEFFIPPAHFTLSNLTITPSRVKEGDKVTISVQVTNDGGVTGSYLAELKIKGMTEMTREITLPPNTNEVINFQVIKRKAGFYPIQIGELTGRIIVEMADQFEEL